MDIFNKFKQIYFSSQGRMSRKSYFLGLALLCAVVFVCFFSINVFFFPSIENFLLWILDDAVVFAIILFILFLKIPFLNLTAKRWHDMNQSGWTSIVLFTPLSVFAFIALMFLPGTSGENQFDSITIAKSNP